MRRGLTFSRFNSSGHLRRLSFARPGKLFTANSSLISAEAGHLTPEAFDRVRNAILALFGKPDD